MKSLEDRATAEDRKGRCISVAMVVAGIVIIAGHVFNLYDIGDHKLGMVIGYWGITVILYKVLYWFIWGDE